MARKDFQGRRVWITGATSGIGAALATELLRRGASVAASGRNSAALQALAVSQAPGHVLTLPFDVTDRAANHAAAESIREAWGGLDVAIFNAGTCEYVDVAAFDAALFQRQLDTNVMSLVYGIEAALPLLRESDRPLLAGMSSLSALKGLPRASAYGASKAAIRNLLESLRLDLLPAGIPVVTILPGFVRTPLTERNDFPMPFQLDADAAARRIADGLERETHEIAFPWQLSLPLRLAALLRSAWVTPLLAKMVRTS
ncbi:MAG TPA: SDR family NAD(P)-dependent oxidoreductase [bacterium]|nr:SDR family NAD(P)-dependent oxidoreductase [bacterium]